MARYCTAEGEITETYPCNPNGSPEGIAALTSPSGRHLALMPHPERCYLTWQNPWVPPELGLDPAGPGPWLKLFQNAREWADSVALSKGNGHVSDTNSHSDDTNVSGEHEGSQSV